MYVTQIFLNIHESKMFERSVLILVNIAVLVETLNTEMGQLLIREC